MKKSRNVKSGTICSYHGDKLVRASSRTKKIAGIWNEMNKRTFLTDEGIKEVVLPDGLQVTGITEVKVR